MLRSGQRRRPLAGSRALLRRRYCQQVLSGRTVKDVRDTLRTALTTAVAEELLARNVAATVRLPTPGNGNGSGGPLKKPGPSWSPPAARATRCTRLRADPGPRASPW